ncbi:MULTISPECIES: hypothetical protein [Nocardiopsis]|uniref:Uncharacterized protein n=1 Tax=Nocardiopsis dassonvillei (strain ATCC 23218 / DSM 43111 / CIP 107115 / JCM 7437 / KCTC 9190 / NBRC 14626 / NCTC 10488 / NRRL B-5397 / IMRU 509) TaxID=446468 RepID=D7B2W7_NOCDD|nr:MULTISPECIES: hypothetical protein [Nocardiopsis]ADH68657.1 conserved hypothetical protein [Nocardiopsis dassonvillei subsp. dassonvillei DSM 43111]APC36722.1 hypothetical protein A9R04_19470 [Nocardiopsis dassonvillei]ASU59662.1 hypothetical protein CGQ36_19740 [Nocardiopsis dassonvillei]NKY80469.1 hypothetical protein [Nocardiopsis dassonvillei]VEI89166.1 Uncharacterised protein [Nocardiopsis dassonvillei]
MAEFRISSDDERVDLRRMAVALAESQGWAREEVSVWDNRRGEVIVTVDDSLLRKPEADPLHRTRHTPRDVHDACETLRREEASLRRVDFRVLRDETARFFSAGWTVADALHALGHRPDGVPWPSGPDYQGTDWLHARLKAWRTPDGDIRPSRSQEEAQLRVISRAGLPMDIGLPEDAEVAQRPVASPAVARSAADDARRLMRQNARTTTDSLAHRDRTSARITRGDRR